MNLIPLPNDPSFGFKFVNLHSQLFQFNLSKIHRNSTFGFSLDILNYFTVQKKVKPTVES